jgi:hypothetical protein
VLVTDWTRQTLSILRERRKLERDGWRQLEVPLDVRQWHHRITEAKIAVDGGSVWIKVQKPTK